MKEDVAEYRRIAETCRAQAKASGTSTDVARTLLELAELWEQRARELEERLKKFLVQSGWGVMLCEMTLRIG